MAANASSATAQAHLLLGRTDEAIDWGRRAVREAVDYAYRHRVLTAALAHAGHVAQASETATAMLRIEPRFTVRGYLARTPLRGSAALLQLAEGLRLAGLPEL
jgi:adenylate cyclase